jgi:hypothetical protein
MVHSGGYGSFDLSSNPGPARLVIMEFVVIFILLEDELYDVKLIVRDRINLT